MSPDDRPRCSTTSPIAIVLQEFPLVYMKSSYTKIQNQRTNWRVGVITNLIETQTSSNRSTSSAIRCIRSSPYISQRVSLTSKGGMWTFVGSYVEMVDFTDLANGIALHFDALVSPGSSTVRGGSEID
jgi:hypothetical protein